MRKKFCLAVLALALILTQGTSALAATHTWDDNQPPTVSDGDTVIFSGSPLGWLIVPEDATVTITGTADITPVDNPHNRFGLIIYPTGTAVLSRANLTGYSISFGGRAGLSLIEILGTGTLLVEDSNIEQAGAGNALSFSRGGNVIVNNSAIKITGPPLQGVV